MFRKSTAFVLLVGLTVSNQFFAFKTPEQLIENPQFTEMLRYSYDKQQKKDPSFALDFSRLEKAAKTLTKSFLVRFVEKPYQDLHEKYGDKTTATYEKKIERSCDQLLKEFEKLCQKKSDEHAFVKAFTKRIDDLCAQLEALTDFLIKKHGKTVDVARFVLWVLARNIFYTGIEKIVDGRALIKDEKATQKTQSMFNSMIEKNKGFIENCERIGAMFEKKFGNDPEFGKEMFKNIEDDVVHFVFADALPVILELGLDTVLKDNEPSATKNESCCTCACKKE